MLMLQSLTGDATFVENYGFDFERNAVYIAHDSMGNPNLAAAEPQIALRPSIYYEGRYGWGAALEFAYRPGACTFLAIVPIAGGKWKFVVGEGEALPVSRVRPSRRRCSGSRPAGRWRTSTIAGVPRARAITRRWPMVGLPNRSRRSQLCLMLRTNTSDRLSPSSTLLG